MCAIQAWMAQCQPEAPGTKRKGIKAGRNPCRQLKPTLLKGRVGFFSTRRRCKLGVWFKTDNFAVTASCQHQLVIRSPTIQNGRSGIKDFKSERCASCTSFLAVFGSKSTKRVTIRLT